MKYIYKLLGIHGFTYYRVNKRWVLISNPAEQKDVIQQELILTRKALEEAKNTLQWYNDNYDSVVAKETLNEIENIINQGSKK